MKREIEKLIKEYVAKYPENNQTQTIWKTPIFGTANADDKGFENLKESVRESHVTPKELLPSAKSVIAFFLPFEEAVAASNVTGYLASKKWSVAYIETNRLIADLSNFIMDYLKEQGYEAASIPATHNFDEETLMSDWSHRHVAEIAGIGKFGLNNMLITDLGCTGRVGSIVTSMVLTASEKIETDYCLYLKDGRCGVCVKKCPQNAFENGYDRFKCYDLCLENDTYHENLGLVDVCGKCCVGLPCSYKNPCNI